MCATDTSLTIGRGSWLFDNAGVAHETGHVMMVWVTAGLPSMPWHMSVQRMVIDWSAGGMRVEPDSLAIQRTCE